MIIATIFVFWLLFVEYRTTGGRHTPALYFMLYMSALMVVSDLLAGMTPFSVTGFFFLAIISGAFWVGHLSGALAFGGRNRRTTINAQPDRDEIARVLALPFIKSGLKISVIMGVIAGILALVALWRAARGAGIVVSSIGDFAQLPAYFSEIRYATGAEDAEPLSVRFFMLILEAGSISGGLLRTLPATRRQRLLQLSPLFVSFLMTMTTGVRSYLFLNCTWYFGTFIAVLCVEGTIFTQLRSPPFLFKSGIMLGIAFLFGSAFAILRYAGENAQQPTFGQFLTQLGPLMASSLSAIVTATIVFDQVSQPMVPLHFASYTFAPVLAWFGLESFRYPPTVYLTSGLSDSNQYSLTGLLLLDFGPLLTAGIYFLTGFFAAAAIFLVRAGVLSALPLLIAIICVILFSLIGNFFFFTTHVALFAAMTLAIIMIQRIVPESRARARNA